jgi:ankyrin repeat protein
LSGHPEPADLVNRVTATTPLHAACQVGSLPIVKELIAYGAKVKKNHLLHHTDLWSQKLTHTHTHTAQINTKIGPEVVRLTPFYLACMHGHHAIVEYFLERCVVRTCVRWCVCVCADAPV